MKLTWSPESAGRAYLEAVRVLGHPSTPEDSDTAGLVAAMAGGFSPRLVLEAPSPTPSPPSTSVALLAASRLSGARLVRLLPSGSSPPHDRNSLEAEAVPADSVAKIDGVDFAVVDCDRVDAAGILRALRVSPRGAVVVCKASGGAARWWKGVVRAGNRVVRSAVLPIGKGIEILHVGVGKGPTLAPSSNRSRWIRHVDRVTGEEHVFRRARTFRTPASKSVTTI